MQDKELIDALDKNSQMQDQHNKMAYILFMQQQRLEEHRTPTTTLTNSYGFNPSNQASELAQWRQVLPRNSRRKSAKFTALNQTLYFCNLDTIIDINSLITAQKNGFTGRMPFAQITLVPGYTFVVDSTDSLYCASLTGNGSLVENAATLNWTEEIYSDVTALPGIINTGVYVAPSELARLTGFNSDVDSDDATPGFLRTGVR